MWTAAFHNPLRSPEIIRWNEIIETAITVSIEIIQIDTEITPATLKNDEVWLEIRYLGTSGQQIGSTISDRKSTFISASSDQDSSSVGWYVGGGSPNTKKQKLSVTFTPQEKGFLHVTVCVGNNIVLYVDPKLLIS